MPTMQTRQFTKHATARGTYWSSLLPATSLLTRMVTLRKSASIGGDEESGFEQAFASLAYVYLKDKAPRLLDYVVGFQLVDRNEDNSKAVGMFGFDVGDQWLYAPVFFLNGDLKGHELLYIKKQDKFVPLKENWVNHMISRQPHVLGEGSKKNTHQLGGAMPDLRRMIVPPLKYGADRHIAEWARPALPLIAALAQKRANALYPNKQASDRLDVTKVAEHPLLAALAPTAKAFDMRIALRDFPLLKFAYERCYRAYPLIKLGFDRFYGPTFFADMASQAKADGRDIIKRAESFILPPHKPKRRGIQLRLTGDDDENGKPELHHKSAQLWVYKAGAIETDPDYAVTDNKPELDEEERERLLKDQVLIKDKRDPVSVTIAYNTTVNLELTNPDATGLYDVLEKPGSFDRMLVITHPHTGKGRENFSTVIRMSDPRAWLNTHRTNIWTRQNNAGTEEEFRKWWDKLPEGKQESLKVGETYVALGDNGSGTCPFRVRQSYGDGAYDVHWENYCQYGQERPAFLPPVERNRGLEWYDDWSNTVRFREEAGRLMSVTGELSIPASYKVFKLKPDSEPKEENDIGDIADDVDDIKEQISDRPASRIESHRRDITNYQNQASPPDDDPYGSDPKPIQPGNLVDIQIMLHKKKAEDGLVDLTIMDTGGGEIWIKARGVSEYMAKRAALISLVRDHGLREAEARVMLKEAAALAPRLEAARYFIKYAEPFGSSLQPGPSSPPFPQPNMGFEPTGYSSVQAIYPQQVQEPVEDMSSSHTDPRIYDPFYMPDAGSMQVAQEAAQQGQKEVFDTSMLSGLLKSVRHHSLVDRYLGDLMNALDKLGRILFLFYWHQEEFEDRYGKADLPELEDSLRNAFEMLGDVTLFLREKTVQGNTGIELGNASVPTDAPDPNLAETARN